MRVREGREEEGGAAVARQVKRGPRTVLQSSNASGGRRSELERERLCCVEYDSLSLSLSLYLPVLAPVMSRPLSEGRALWEKDRERERPF